MRVRSWNTAEQIPFFTIKVAVVTSCNCNTRLRKRCFFWVPPTVFILCSSFLGVFGVQGSVVKFDGWGSQHSCLQVEARSNGQNLVESMEQSRNQLLSGDTKFTLTPISKGWGQPLKYDSICIRKNWIRRRRLALPRMWWIWLSLTSSVVTWRVWRMDIDP